MTLKKFLLVCFAALLFVLVALLFLSPELQQQVGSPLIISVLGLILLDGWWSK